MILILLVLGLCFLLSLPTLHQVVRRGRLDPLSPLILFTFFTFAGFIVPLLSFMAEEDPFTKNWFLTYEDESSIEWALVFASIGVLGFYAGYAAVKAVPRRPAPGIRTYAWDPVQFRAVAVAYTVVGSLMFGLGILRVGGLGTLLAGMVDRIRLFTGLNYFFSAINLLLVVSLVWWSNLLRTGKVRSKPFWLYTILALGASSLQGSKSNSYVFIMTLLVMYHHSRKPLRLLWLAATAVVLIVAVSVYQVVMREYFAVGEFVTVDSSLESAWGVITHEFMGHFMQLQMMTVLVERVPSVIPYQYGQTFLAIVTAAIPSSIMPDKFTPSTVVLADYIWPDAWRRSGTTMPPGLMGEMYLNFGATGIFFGLLVFGAAYALWDRALESDALSPVRGFLRALALALMLHYLRGEVMAPTVMLLLFGVPSYVAFRLCWRPTRSAPGRIEQTAVAAQGVQPPIPAQGG